MNPLFSEIPRAQIPRSSFDRSSSYRTTFKAGDLIPVYIDEVLPGDTFNMQHNFLCRLTTPLSVPIMDTMYFDMFYFFIPMRLVWENWERMHGAQDYPGASTDYQIPTDSVYNLIAGSSSASVATKELADPDSGSGQFPLINHLGVGSSNGYASRTIKISVLPLRAYWLVWNEWFRDENLQSAVKIDTSDGSGIGTWFDTSTAFYSDLTTPGDTKVNLLHFPAPSAKLHDYFTSSLPFPQKGPGVELPLGQTAQLAGSLTIPASNVLFNGESLKYVGAVYSMTPTYASKLLQLNSGSNGGSQGGTGAVSSTVASQTIPAADTGLSVDLSSATAVTINSLRQAFQLQKLYERDARGGTRYKEILLSHYGVVSPDARLQRPEYLGGFSDPISVNTVAQTADTDNSPLGNLAAFAVSRVSKHGFTKSFTEFGYLLGIARVRTVPSYQQGIDKLWLRKTRTDFYYPVFSHLGEQPVYLSEIYATDSVSSLTTVFGYQERYAELRYKLSRITGAFNSCTTSSLDIYHLGQKFASVPGLNSEFIQERPPIDRVSAVSAQAAAGAQFLLDAYYRLKCVRVMPLYGTPELVDHF